MGHPQLNTLVMEEVLRSTSWRDPEQETLLAGIGFVRVDHTLKCMMIVELDRVESSDSPYDVQPIPLEGVEPNIDPMTGLPVLT